MLEDGVVVIVVVDEEKKDDKHAISSDLTCVTNIVNKFNFFIILFYLELILLI